MDRVLVGRGHPRADGLGLAGLLGRMVGSPGGPTALWSSSHTLAPLLLEALALGALEVPLECSFLTFGDSPWAAAYRPSISVLTSDLGSVGAFMAEALLHDLGVTGAAPDWEVEPDRFVPKGGLGPAPSRLISPPGPNAGLAPRAPGTMHRQGCGVALKFARLGCVHGEHGRARGVACRDSGRWEQRSQTENRGRHAVEVPARRTNRAAGLLVGAPSRRVSPLDPGQERPRGTCSP